MNSSTRSAPHKRAGATDQSRVRRGARPLVPSHIVTGEDFAHGIDEPVFRDRELRRTALAPLLVRGDESRGFRALDQILDLHLAPGLLVAALDDHARGATAVGIGRPFVYGLALAGETGVQTVMEYLLAELDLTMALNGCPTIRDISPDLLGVKQNL